MFICAVYSNESVTDCVLCRYSENLHISHNRMLFGKIVLILGIIKCARTMLCNEDVHCAEGLFCDIRTHSCRNCYNCIELNRLPPINANSCIRTGVECGPCVENFVQYFEWSAKCTPPPKEERNLPFPTPHGFFWLTWIFIAFVISYVFIQVITSTHFVKVVGYNVAKSSSVQGHDGFYGQHLYYIYFKNNETEEFIV